ncbi:MULTISPECIES: hypothetical protein [Vibrio]|uniref:Core-binding (CB) domain-containing protein n=2 Tax=Vibrio TaxID=662 RepID=A0A3A6QSF7_9VIBR|nr:MULTISPECIES: hypothetical protein [Vibrio]ODS04585.1 hypothetical protein VSF3289_03724 [Vibrio scophthalmi]RJX75705.1 hypothetical protein DZ860_03250 [Vibrio sinensis]
MKMNNRPTISTPIRSLIRNGDFSRFLNLNPPAKKSSQGECAIKPSLVRLRNAKFSTFNIAESTKGDVGMVTRHLNDCEQLFTLLRIERHNDPTLSVLYYRIHYFLSIVGKQQSLCSTRGITKDAIRRYNAYLNSNIKNNLERKMHISAVRFFFRQLCRHGISSHNPIRRLNLKTAY